MPKARVNGIELAYEVYGEGAPLVLAHGFAATKEMWDGQIGPFSEKYRVVVYDVRGHGETEAPPVDDAGYTLANLVEDQRALMAHLGIERAYIGGLSLGGMIAMRFALAHPEQTRALLLCDTSPGMGAEGLFAKNRLMMEGLVRAQGVGAIMRGLYTQGATAGTLPKAGDLPKGALDHAQRWSMMTPDGFLGVARAAGDAASVLNLLGEIATPTLIITGDRDFFRGASEEMHKQMPDSRFVLIENSIHGSCVWQPERFTSAVLDFLSDVDAGRPVAAS